MFPNVYGFHWTAGHLIFLGLFFAAVLTVFSTVTISAWRARRNLLAEKLNHIRWHSEFHDLPVRDRACRHDLTGEFMHRTCPNAFDCRECETHESLTAARPPAAAADAKPFGLSFPQDRLYHRGHTWAREEADGTVTVGLDDFAARLVGKPDEVILPKPGEQLEVNGPGFTLRRGGNEVRVLAPVEGEVVATGGPGEAFYLKLKPAGPKADTSHLLRGAEVQAWLAREMERLQLALSTRKGAPALADGGVLVDDLPKSYPQADWDAVWGEIFLEP